LCGAAMGAAAAFEIHDRPLTAIMHSSQL